MTGDDEQRPEFLRLHDPRVVDAPGRLVDLTDIDEAELNQIVRVMNALYRWREAEQRVSVASRRYMQLGETDMLALRFLIVMADQGRSVVGRDIAEHLGISSAATTKLLDRLEAAGHIRRSPHPTDRRSITIKISPETRQAAERTIGREHARRFREAAALPPDDRETVINFLERMSATGEADWATHDSPSQDHVPNAEVELNRVTEGGSAGATAVPFRLP